MKPNTKKIIAREFLILITCIVLALSTFLGTSIYNKVKDYKAKNINLEISHLQENIDSLSIPLNKKEEQQISFFDSFGEEVQNVNFTAKELWDVYQESHEQDSLIYKWYHPNDDRKIIIGYLKKAGFETGEQLDSFIGENSFTEKDLKSKDSINVMKKDISVRKKNVTQHISNKYTDNQKIELSFISLIILLSICYPLRYLFIAIKWSIKTLKT